MAWMFTTYVQDSAQSLNWYFDAFSDAAKSRDMALRFKFHTTMICDVISVPVDDYLTSHCEFVEYVRNTCGKGLAYDRESRFADNRKDRYVSMPWKRQSKWALRRNAMSKACAKQFEAVRKDKRFAITALAAALEVNGFEFESEYLDRTYRAMLAKDFARDDTIPSHLYTQCGAHRAKSDATKIACYPTLADANRGREVVMSAGKFFKATMPERDDSDIRTLAEAFIEHGKPAKVHFAITSDEWVEVYRSNRGFRSCMTDFKDTYYHPVRFYAYPGNGLRLAYLETDGDTTARCIVNVEKMKYVRVYGDGRLETALDKLGYSHDPNGALHGVKCAAIEHPSGGIVAPYLDCSGGFDWNGCADYVTVCANGAYEGDSTDGRVDIEDDRELCERCGDPTNEYDMHFSHVEEVSICSGCASSHYTMAIYDRHRNETYIHDDNVIEINDQWYWDNSDLLTRLGFVYCDHSEEWVNEDDAVFLSYCDQYAKIDNCSELDIETDSGDNWALSYDTKRVVIAGEEKLVHVDYDGITDADLASARKAARKYVARHCRKFSRGPNRRNKSIIQRKRRKAFANFAGSYN